jgi:gamma-butyrobetaine dioxygenase
MVLLEELAPDDGPLSVALEGETIDILWRKGRHRSVYNLRWLREHCYSHAERETRRLRPTLVDAHLAERLPRFHRDRYMDTDAGLLEVMEAVRDCGHAILEGAVIDNEEIVRLANRFGPIRETNYGSINDMMVHESKIVISYTDAALTVHADEPYCYEPLGVGFFHCMAAAMDEGGASIFVDAFKVAEDMQRESPDNFRILSTVPQQFMRDHVDEQEYRAEGPVISLDYFGGINGIRFAERPLAPMDIPEELVEPNYRALGEFARRIPDPANEIRFKMKAGDVTIFDNQRMLHGRTAFKGSRHLRTAYVERDFFHSNLRVLSRRLGRPISGRLPGGGWLGEAELSYAGMNALARAKLAVEVLEERLRLLALDVRSRNDIIGLASILDDDGGSLRRSATGAAHGDYRIRLAARGSVPDTVQSALREMLSLWAAGPAGAAGFRERLERQVFTSSVLVDRGRVRPAVALIEVGA